MGRGTLPWLRSPVRIIWMRKNEGLDWKKHVRLRLREMRGKPPKIMLHYYFVTLVTR
jgi:hypothetical protein